MIAPVLALVVALASPDVMVLSVRSASVLPEGRTALQLDGGFAALRLDLPVAEILPALTGDAEIVHGIGHGADVAVRYTTHLGIIHRLGPVLRVNAIDAAGWALAARLHPSAQIAGAWQEGFDYGGELATSAALLATRRTGIGALTAEAGFSVQWIVFDHRDGEGTRTTDVPYVAYIDLALELEHALSATSHLTVRGELAISLTPDDPFALLGTYPRLVVGGNVEL